MANEALRKYEQKIIREMEEAKSWKKIWKAIELSSICSMLNK